MFIHGAGHFHPENVIDNKFLEDLDIETNDSWIMERVGIRSRRTVLPLEYIRQTKNENPSLAREVSIYTNAETGAKAARMAADRAGISLSSIGLVISGSCTPEFACPAEACTIANELGIKVPAFDINSACSSLAAQLNFLFSMNDLPDYVLLVNPENNTRAINYSDRTQAVLWGDCSSALIVSKRIPSFLRVIETCFTSNPQGWDKVMFPVGKHFSQDGRTVQRFAIKKTVEVIRNLCRLVPKDRLESLKFIGHQANLMMLNSVCEYAEIASENHYFNVDKFGNTGAAGAPSNLSLNWQSLCVGDFVLLAVVGSGLSWGGALMEVGNNDGL